MNIILVSRLAAIRILFKKNNPTTERKRRSQFDISTVTTNLPVYVLQHLVPFEIIPVRTQHPQVLTVPD